jgi:hypothetical protein
VSRFLVLMLITGILSTSVGGAISLANAQGCPIEQQCK